MKFEWVTKKLWNKIYQLDRFDLTQADKGLKKCDGRWYIKKDDLANLKSNVDKLHINKLKTFLVDLSKWSNVGNNDAVKKDVYNRDKKILDKKNRRC